MMGVWMWALVMGLVLGLRVGREGGEEPDHVRQAQKNPPTSTTSSPRLWVTNRRRPTALLKDEQGQAQNATKDAGLSSTSSTTASNETKVNTTQASTTQVNTTQVSTTQVNTTQVSTTQVNTTQVSTTRVSTTTKVNTTQVSTTTKVNTKRYGGEEMAKGPLSDDTVAVDSFEKHLAKQYRCSFGEVSGLENAWYVVPWVLVVVAWLMAVLVGVARWRPQRHTLKQLPELISELDEKLGQSCGPGSLLKSWGDREEMAPAFFEEWFLVNDEMNRCTSSTLLAFDFWKWGHHVKRRYRKPPGEKYFNLSLLIPYGRTIRMGIQDDVFWFKEHDPQYDTIQCDSQVALPTDKDPRNRARRRNRQSGKDDSDESYYNKTDMENVEDESKKTERRESQGLLPFIGRVMSRTISRNRFSLYKGSKENLGKSQKSKERRWTRRVSRKTSSRRITKKSKSKTPSPSNHKTTAKTDTRKILTQKEPKKVEKVWKKTVESKESKEVLTPKEVIRVTKPTTAVKEKRQSITSTSATDLSPASSDRCRPGHESPGTATAKHLSKSEDKLPPYP